MDAHNIVQQPTSMDALMPLFSEQLALGKSVRFAPRGVSMLPMLRQGIDSVVLSPLPEKIQKYDVIFYRRGNGRYVLHRVVKCGKTFTCIGDNQYTLEPGICREQMIARVSGFYRKDRYWACDSPLYRFYCRFWHFTRPVRSLWHRGLGWLRRHFR